MSETNDSWLESKWKDFRVGTDAIVDVAVGTHWAADLDAEYATEGQSEEAYNKRETENTVAETGKDQTNESTGQTYHAQTLVDQGIIKPGESGLNAAWKKTEQQIGSFVSMSGYLIAGAIVLALVAGAVVLARKA
jgi:hypothetical protein